MSMNWSIHHVNLAATDVRKTARFKAEMIRFTEGSWVFPPPIRRTISVPTRRNWNCTLLLPRARATTAAYALYNLSPNLYVRVHSIITCLYAAMWLFRFRTLVRWSNARTQPAFLIHSLVLLPFHACDTFMSMTRKWTSSRSTKLSNSCVHGHRRFDRHNQCRQQQRIVVQAHTCVV